MAEPPRILYLAVADARGHLMRAHLLRGLLGSAGIHVDVVTTSAEGQRFLEALGTPSSVLSEHMRMEFGERHDMRRPATERRVARYLALPSRGLRDLSRVVRLARGAAFVVNDSLHPALLLAPVLLGAAPRVVNVCSEHLWTATEQWLGPGRTAAMFASVIRACRARSFADIEHGLREPRTDPGRRRVRLPTPVAAPRRTAHEVRAALSLGPRDRLATVYLNPHFRDPAIAGAIEAALGDEGFKMVAVGEGFVGRPGWTGQDGALGDVVATSDVLITGAGAGALSQARTYGTPVVVILGSQPEQTLNLSLFASLEQDHPLASVSLDRPTWAGDLREAVAAAGAARRRPPTDPTYIHALWTETFLYLVHQARKEDDHAPTDHRPRPRDEQLARRQPRRDPHRLEPRPPARAPRAPDASPVGAR